MPWSRVIGKARHNARLILPSAGRKASGTDCWMVSPGHQRQYRDRGNHHYSGSDFYRTHVPNHDAPVVERLKAAGALVAYKSALHEFAFGIRTTSRFQAKRSILGTMNAFRWIERGSAAAVAAGLRDAAIGTDTGGSVRLPAAMCGITGLSPVGPCPIGAVRRCVHRKTRSGRWPVRNGCGSPLRYDSRF